MLNRVGDVFNLVTQANTNERPEKVEAYEAPRQAANQDAIYLNNKLFARVKAIYEKRESLGLDPGSRRLVEYEYQQFVKAGGDLPRCGQGEATKLERKSQRSKTRS